MASILKATQNAWPSEGPPIKKGRTYSSDAPQLAGLSEEQLAAWFEPFTPDFPARAEAPVEQATARPGEKRNSPRRTKKGE